MSSEMANNECSSTVDPFDWFLGHDEGTTEEIIEGEKKDDDPTLNHLSWRMDRIESHSDWTILVSRKPQSNRTQTDALKPGQSLNVDTDGNANSKEDVESYHVHKTVLSIGPKKSGFFSDAFGIQAESTRAEASPHKSTTTELSLDEISADAFPSFLDYMYDTANGTHITRENAAALMYLADYLDIPALRDDTEQFIDADLNDLLDDGVDNGESTCVYWKHASFFGQRVRPLCCILKDYLKNCFEENDIVFSECFFSYVPLPIMIQAMKETSQFESFAATKDLLAANVLNCIKSHNQTQSGLNQHYFERLTSEELLPYIHYSAAQELVLLEEQILGSPKVEMTNLTQRCLVSIKNRCMEIDLFEGLKSGDEEALQIKSFLIDYPVTVLMDIMMAVNSHQSAIKNKTISSLKAEIALLRSRQDAAPRKKGKSCFQ